MSPFVDIRRRSDLRKIIKLSEDAKRLLDLIPMNGRLVGNITLQLVSQLGEHYWNVRDELVEAGLIMRWKGRGGTVARIFQGPSISVVVASSHRRGKK
jgi:hypothetical protein